MVAEVMFTELLSVANDHNQNEGKKPKSKMKA